MKVACIAAAIVVVAVALPYLVYGSEPLALDEKARLDAPGRFLELTLGRVYYLEEGPPEGPPVVLVPGLSVPAFVWDPTVPALTAGGSHVVRYDIYGRGWSDRPDVSYDLDLHDRQLSELVDRLFPRRPVDLVGLSMGALIAATYVARRPDRVRKLVLMGPAGLPFEAPLAVRLLYVPALGDYLMRVRGETQLWASTRASFRLPERFPDFEGRYREQMRFRGFKRAVLSSYRRMPLGDLTETYRRVQEIGRPVLVVWGKDDRICPYRNRDRLRQLIPGAAFLDVDDAGHLAHYERPEVVNPAIVAFLAR